MNEAVQLCAHLRRHGNGTRTVTAGNLSVELCKRCVKDLDIRLTEQRRAATPIEQLADREGVRMQQGCIYEVRKAPTVHCRLACEPGKAMCPRHLAIVGVRAAVLPRISIAPTEAA